MHLFPPVPLFPTLARLLHWAAPRPREAWKPTVTVAQGDDCLLAWVDLRDVDWSGLEIDATTYRLWVTGRRAASVRGRRDSRDREDEQEGARFRCVVSFPYPVSSAEMCSEIRGDMLWMRFPFQR